MTEREAEEHIKEIDNWTLFAASIEKQFEFKDFDEAMQFVNAVAEIAETEGHHPDITVRYNKVTLELMTHAIGGLSMNDFILAAKIDSISQ